jgi:hypothetical protein
VAHRIDQSTGRAAIAYIGEPPWHGLGQKLEAGADIEKWTTAAGLGWSVQRSPVQFNATSAFHGPLQPGWPPLLNFNSSDVLYRSDTGAPWDCLERVQSCATQRGHGLFR